MGKSTQVSFLLRTEPRTELLSEYSEYNKKNALILEFLLEKWEHWNNECKYTIFQNETAIIANQDRHSIPYSSVRT